MEKYQHIAFCALVSLGIHSRDNGSDSFIQENIFILRWLTTAKKNKCFSPVFDSYLEKLTDLTRQQISTTSMKRKLESFYQFSSLEHVAQTDYYRLQQARQELNNAGYRWFNLSASELQKKLGHLNEAGIFTEKTAFSLTFTTLGKQIAPLRMIVPRMDSAIVDIFSRNNFQINGKEKNNLLWMLSPC